ncbi:hypothetical protein [Yersinia bercovieri]|uniref:hypothetical protein n=1 Tax=Yersinia bercovieri TaxID=634 RepID=UPI0025AA7FF9|nr:hypothetical protein [Yersinia bercovieri]MDN0105223.1 hypothetical protein [Yersinia bercovieri]
MSEIKQLKRFIYSATVTSGSGSQSFYIDAESREEADERAANNESDGMYADDSEVTDLDALEYEDETTVDDFGDFPLISREQSLIAQLEAAQKELSAANEKLKGEQVPVATNNGVTAENRRVIKMLLDVCGTAFELADDSCQQDVDGELCHVVPASAFSRLSDALAEIENTLPDEYEDMPNIILRWAAIPHFALQELFPVAPLPAGFTVEGE